MPDHRHKTIKESIVGAIAGEVSNAGLGNHVAFVAELLFALSSYREEDTLLYPTVFVFGDEDKSSQLSVVAPGAERIRLGRCSPGMGNAELILKKSATLAAAGWSVFVAVGGAEYSFGVFRSEVLPFSISSSERLADATSDGSCVVIARKTFANTVELSRGGGHTLSLELSAAEPRVRRSIEDLTTLAKVTSCDFEDCDPRATQYLANLFQTSFRKGHGVLLAVVDCDVRDLDEKQFEGVRFDPEPGLLSCFHELLEHERASELARLSAFEALFVGAICSDGVVIMDTKGNLLGFRFFVHPTEKERDAVLNSGVVGGARSRAFELLKMRIGSPLRGAFFQSQDGTTQMEVSHE